VLVGRSSPFSSVGPTRDGRWKPDISAPGQYVTSALANNSELSTLSERALLNQRLVTIEGTSMATPIVTGAIALMLQKKPSLTQKQILDLFTQNARRDQQTGPALWTPTYGHGKLDIAALLGKI
jgi:subtilisin family serine protease